MSLILVPGYKQSSDNKSLNVYDLTGLYNVSTNPTGYGSSSYAPHPLPSDMVEAFVYIYATDATTRLPDMTAFAFPNSIATAAIDVFGTLPTLNKSIPYNITSTAVFGSDQVWRNGIYRGVYFALDGGDVQYYTDVRFPIIGGVLCCIQNLIIEAENCGCTGKNHHELLLVKAQLDQLIASTPRELGGKSAIENCNLFNKGAEIIIAAEAMCSNAGCNPCGGGC